MRRHLSKTDVRELKSKVLDPPLREFTLSA